MKRIFFVEDDPGLMKGLVFALEKQGYEVVARARCTKRKDAGKMGHSIL